MEKKYRIGETAPHDGTVQCTQPNGEISFIKQGEAFKACPKWSSHGGQPCRWEYID